MNSKSITPIAVILLTGLVTGSVAGVSPAPQAAPASQAVAAGSAQLATINQYCVGCHNDRAKTAGFSFEGLKPENIGERAELFEKAVRKLRGRVMPPPGSKQPDAKDIDSLVTWLETSLDRAEGKAHIPDQLVLHRLNRKEYAN